MKTWLFHLWADWFYFVRNKFACLWVRINDQILIVSSLQFVKSIYYLPCLFGLEATEATGSLTKSNIQPVELKSDRSKYEFSGAAFCVDFLFWQRKFLPCSLELISLTYQPWNNVFLSQQISFSYLISRRNHQVLIKLLAPWLASCRNTL